jgi:hypothetical protein
LIQNINIDGLMWFLCRINTILMQCFKYPLILFLHCPCLCCHSFLWYHVVFLSGSESLQGVFLNQLFIYVSQLEIQLSRGSSRDPINRKRKFKQWWSTIPPLSTKQTTLTSTSWA